MGGGYIIVRKIFVTKKWISPKMRRNHKKIDFCILCLQQIILFHVKFESRMFSALIWCTYCPCSSKIGEVRIFTYGFFEGQTRWLWRPLTGKVCNIEDWSNNLHVAEDVSFHLRPCLVDLAEKWQCYRSKTKMGASRSKYITVAIG